MYVPGGGEENPGLHEDDTKNTNIGDSDYQQDGDSDLYADEDQSQSNYSDSDGGGGDYHIDGDTDLNINDEDIVCYDKITICHHPSGEDENLQTISILCESLEDHYKHGDYVGECR